MKKGFLKKLSVCAISAATVISAASCGFIGGGQDDLSAALSNLSSLIESDLSSAVSQTTGVSKMKSPFPFPLRSRRITFISQPPETVAMIILKAIVPLFLL